MVYRPALQTNDTLRGISIGRILDFESSGWRFESAPLSHTKGKTMPEILLVIALVVFLVIGMVFLFDPYSGGGERWFSLLWFGAFGLCVTWIAVGNATRAIESTRVYEVSTVGETLDERKQIAVVDGGVVDVTATVYKLVDEEHCKLGVTTWELFSVGLLPMFDQRTDYEVVCGEANISNFLEGWQRK